MPACSWLFEKLEKQSNRRPLLPAPAWVPDSHPARLSGAIGCQNGSVALPNAHTLPDPLPISLLFNDMSG